MNSDQLLQARKLLKQMQQEDSQIVIQAYNTGYRSGCEQVDSTTIDWLISNRLIICIQTIGIFENSKFDIEIYKITELGSLVEMFSVLSDEWDTFASGNLSLDNFYTYGKNIFSIIQKYNDEEVDPLSKLITSQEQEAYNHYYRQSIQQILKNRSSTDKNENENNSTLTHTILPMFQMSVNLGEKGSNCTRTEEYVLRKINEELGEMTLEMNIRDGLSYKDAGSDGVAGEAVDLAICAMDMFALQYPEKSAEEIEYLFITYMHKKIEKWKKTIGL